MKKHALEPKPLIEFNITDECNYKCKYCVQGKRRKTHKECSNANDDVIDAFEQLIKELEGEWTIKLIGGEPLMHPRILEIIEAISLAGHKVSIITNFSFPVEKYKKIIDASRGKLEDIFASLHLSQVKSVDDFIQKAVEIDAYKDQTTNLKVLSVVTEEYFSVLKEVKLKLEENNVKIRFQHLKYKINNQDQYHEYSDEINTYLKNNPGNYYEEYNKIKDTTSFARLCYAGCKFIVIKHDGSVKRCHSKQMQLQDLGNIKNGQFNLLAGAMPCLAQKCTCALPFGRNMIKMDKKDYLRAFYFASCNYIKSFTKKSLIPSKNI